MFCKREVLAEVSEQLTLSRAGLLLKRQRNFPEEEGGKWGKGGERELFITGDSLLRFMSCLVLIQQH